MKKKEIISDTISSVVYSAVDGKGDDQTVNVLVFAKHINTNTVVKSYIIGGTSNNGYIAKCLVTTTGGDLKAFYVK